MSTVSQMECESQTFRGRSTFDLNDDSMLMSSGEIKIEYIIANNVILHIYHKNDKRNHKLSVLTSSPASTKSETWEIRKTEGFVLTEEINAI